MSSIIQKDQEAILSVNEVVGIWIVWNIIQYDTIPALEGCISIYDTANWAWN